MPKLDQAKQLARTRRIEEAALSLFVRRGFHGVGLRDIATKARVSLGNIYNHFSGKEPIFRALMRRLYIAFATDFGALDELVETQRFPNDLVAVGHAIGKLVERHRNYLTLVYVDIAEFDGKHARPHYENLAGKLNARMKSSFQALRKRKALPASIDPAVAFTVVYMQFANYFIVERRIGGRHLGLDDDAAVAVIAKVLGDGLRRGGKR
jgi:AcrR family transcriptional regulator